MKHRTSNYALSRVLDGDRELLALRFKDFRERWTIYDVEFRGITEQEWIKSVSDKDGRDVPFVFETVDGARHPFASIGDGYRPASRQFFAIGGGGYSVHPEGISFALKRALGWSVPDVPQAQAPYSWMPLRRGRVKRKLKSADDEDLSWVLVDFTTRYVRPKDVPWAETVLARYLTHPDKFVVKQATVGLGELARVHGYNRAQTVDKLIELRRQAADKLLQWTLDRALSDIRRFSIASQSR